jgi:hypothetical protein
MLAMQNYVKALEGSVQNCNGEWIMLVTQNSVSTGKCQINK